MGKSFRDTVVDPKSVYFKTGHNRGVAREKDRHSHHSHRVANQGCDDGSFVPFGKKFLHNNTYRTFHPAYQRSNVYHDTRDLISYFNENGWEGGNLHESLQSQLKNKALERSDQLYLKKSMKQVERRGSASRFTGHDKYTEKVER